MHVISQRERSGLTEDVKFRISAGPLLAVIQQPGGSRWVFAVFSNGRDLL